MMTSGVLVMAKKQLAAGPLAGQFRFVPCRHIFYNPCLPAYLHPFVCAACCKMSSFADIHLVGNNTPVMAPKSIAFPFLLLQMLAVGGFMKQHSQHLFVF